MNLTNTTPASHWSARQMEEEQFGKIVEMEPTALVTVKVDSICVPATLSRFPSLVLRTLTRFIVRRCFANVKRPFTARCEP